MPIWNRTEEPNQSTQALPKINVILEGTSVRGDTSSGKKKHWKQVLTTVHQQNLYHEPIIFTPEDEEGVTYSHEDALVIFMVLANHRVHGVLVDDRNSVNILSKDVMS